MKHFYEMTISSSPHIRGEDTTATIMRDVLIALLPALCGACYFFGFRALTLSVVSCAFCVFFEWAYRKMRKMDNTILDGSAVVTGLLLAMVCPVGLPYWALIVGDFFAIIVVKQLFGGIGKNFMNPALMGRAILMACWPVFMTTWAPVFSRTSIVQSTAAAVDAVSSATPLSVLHTGQLPDVPLANLYLGNVSGSLGETSVLLLLVGFLYLLVRRVISARIPLCFVGTVAVLTFLFPQGNDRLTFMAYELCSGGLMLGAIFMATDYVTSPVTKWGQILFGVGCGALTVFIRRFGSYPEGVSYAILVMNACVVLLDKVGIPKRFGVAVKGGAAQ